MICTKVQYFLDDFFEFGALRPCELVVYVD